MVSLLMLVGLGPSPSPTAGRPTVSIVAKLGEVQEALGVLLAMMQVGWQVVWRPEGADLSTRVPPPWWLEGGHMWFEIEVPREDVGEYLDARGNLREGAELEIWQRALQTEGAGDVMCVALALRVGCSISVAVRGDRSGGLFQLGPDKCVSDEVKGRSE